MCLLSIAGLRHLMTLKALWLNAVLGLFDVERAQCAIAENEIAWLHFVSTGDFVDQRPFKNFLAEREQLRNSGSNNRFARVRKNIFRSIFKKLKKVLDRR